MDAVAARAGAGKGSLYRRWPGRAELVADAVRHAMPEFVPPPDDGDLRDQLTAALRRCADDLHGPSGQASRGLLAEAVRSPDRRRRAAAAGHHPLTCPAPSSGPRGAGSTVSPG